MAGVDGAWVWYLSCAQSYACSLMDGVMERFEAEAQASLHQTFGGSAEPTFIRLDTSMLGQPYRNEKVSNIVVAVQINSGYH